MTQGGALHSPLLSNDGSTRLVSLFYELHERPARDKFWKFAYLACLFSSLGVGLYSLFNQNALFAVLMDPSYLNDPGHCPDKANAPMLGQLKGTSDITPKYFLESGGVLVGGSMLAALAVACVFMLLLQHNPGALVTFTVVLQVAAPAALGLLAMSAGNDSMGLVCLGVAVSLAISFYLSRSSLKMVASLLGLSARALREKPGMAVLVVLLNLVLVLLWLFFGAAIAATAANGHVVANPLRVYALGDKCTTAYGEAITCCMWVPEPWTQAYYPLASATMLWTTLLIFEIKVYTIAGAVCQWYWAPMGTSGSKGATFRALRFALGPSFGSLCFGSFCLVLISYVRAVIDRFRKRTHGSLVSALVAACLACVTTLLEVLTKFATVRMAMTGHSLLAAGRDVVDLLRRNSMDAYNVWWLPPVVLRLCSFMLSALMGYATYEGAYWWWSQRPEAGAAGMANESAAVLATLSGLMSFFMMTFLSSVMLNIVDAMFICFAVDRDNRACTRMEVHQVYAQLPSVGPVVQQPDGGFAYGAPITPPAGYAPPMLAGQPSGPHGMPIGTGGYSSYVYPGQAPASYTPVGPPSYPPYMGPSVPPAAPGAVNTVVVPGAVATVVVGGMHAQQYPPPQYPVQHQQQYVPEYPTAPPMQQPTMYPKV